MNKLDFNKKILIILTLIIILFSFIFSSSCFAVSSTEVDSFSNTVISKIKSLEKFNSYLYFIAVYYNYANFNQIQVFLFNDNENLKFCIDDYHSLETLYSNLKFNGYAYTLNFSDLSISEERSFTNGGYVFTHVNKVDGYYRVYSNYDIYSDSSYTDFFSKAPLKTVTVVLSQEIKRAKMG